MPAPMRGWLSSWALSAVVVMGCSNARLADGGTTLPTLLRLSPQDFLGGVPCMPDSPGGLREYTVELFEVELAGDGGVAGERLVSTSPPVSCRNAVVFQASSGRFYVADVRGFDRTVAPDVAPRWMASCGRGPDGEGPPRVGAGQAEFGPARASFSSTVPVVGCTPLRELMPGTQATAVAVDITDALGELRCGTGPGNVSSFAATLGERTLTAACGDAVVFDDVTAGATVEIAVVAFEGEASDAGAPDASVAVDAGPSDGGADAALGDAAVTEPGAGLDGGVEAPPPSTAGVPRWATTCTARPNAGVETRARCEALSPIDG